MEGKSPLWRVNEKNVKDKDSGDNGSENYDKQDDNSVFAD